MSGALATLPVTPDAPALVPDLVHGPDRPPASVVIIRHAPREMGVILVSLGTAGILIPGPFPPGTLFILAGVVFLYPQCLGKPGSWFRRRFPAVYDGLTGSIERFRNDLEFRYPGSLVEKPAPR